MFNILDCPGTLTEVNKLPGKDQAAIFKQNAEIATAIYNNWVGEASEEAQAIPNEDAYSFIFKHRRDILLEIMGGYAVYSWRKRHIAGRILYLMGYDIPMEGLTDG